MNNRGGSDQDYAAAGSIMIGRSGFIRDLFLWLINEGAFIKE